MSSPPVKLLPLMQAAPPFVSKVLTAAVLPVIVALMLASCAGQPAATDASSDWPSHRKQLEQLQHWSARGKAALRRDGAVETASLLWRQQAAASELRLTGPLGAGATTLRMVDQLLTIDSSAERTVIDLALTPHRVAQETGWDLPIGALSYWLRGVPSPKTAPTQIDTDPITGTATRILQSQWTVEYASYARFDGYQLPTRITLNNGRQRITVLLRQWQVGDKP